VRRSTAIAVALIVFTGCGGGGDDGGPGLTDLSGIWANDEVTLRVNDAGDFIVQPSDSEDEVLMGGFVARDEDSFIFVTGIGGQCPGTRGTYKAAVDSATLVLTLEDDPCLLRAGWFADPLSAVSE